ncbi:DegV family protein [Fusibacter tunisiensis]
MKEYIDKGYDIRLIDSKLNSSAEGMMALKAAQMANAGDSIDEIVTQIESEVPRTDIYVSLDTLKYAVKGGRVPNVLGKFLMRIGAKAIMTLKRSGEGTAFGLAFSRKQLDAKIMKHVSKIMATDGIERYSLVHAGNPKCAAEYAEQFTQIVGKPPEYITPISAITTIHSGIGSVAISLVRGKANVN